MGIIEEVTDEYTIYNRLVSCNPLADCTVCNQVLEIQVSPSSKKLETMIEEETWAGEMERLQS